MSGHTNIILYYIIATLNLQTMHTWTYRGNSTQGNTLNNTQHPAMGNHRMTHSAPLMYTTFTVYVWEDNTMK